MTDNFSDRLFQWPSVWAPYKLLGNFSLVIFPLCEVVWRSQISYKKFFYCIVHRQFFRRAKFPKNRAKYGVRGSDPPPCSYVFPFGMVDAPSRAPPDGPPEFLPHVSNIFKWNNRLQLIKNFSNILKEMMVGSKQFDSQESFFLVLDVISHVISGSFKPIWDFFDWQLILTFPRYTYQKMNRFRSIRILFPFFSLQERERHIYFRLFTRFYNSY